jgi:hypothetical protein
MIQKNILMKSVKLDAYEVGHTFTLLFSEKRKKGLGKNMCYAL